MTREECRLQLNGEPVVLDPSGALWWPAEKTLVVADLHFEKGSAFAKGGQLLPPYDTRATLKRLETLRERFRPERVIALGDSFHDQGAGARLDAEEIAGLMWLTGSAEWIWVEGNHDPDPPAWLGGRVVAEFALKGLCFRHIPGAEPGAGEVAGHLHPVVRIHRGGLRALRRCFVSDGTRLVLPAFGAYTGGLDVRQEPIAALFAGGFAVYALGRDRVYAVAGAPHLLRKKSEDSQPKNTAIRTVEKP